MSNKLKLLKKMGILGDIRQRLGAKNEEDTSFDKTIEMMSTRDIVAAEYGWELGDNSWGYNIIDLYLRLTKALDKEKENE